MYATFCVAPFKEEHMDQAFRHNILLALLPLSADLALRTTVIHQRLQDQGINVSLRVVQRDLKDLANKFPHIKCRKDGQASLWWANRSLSHLSLLPTDAMNLTMIMDHAARFGMQAQVERLSQLREYALSLWKGTRPAEDYSDKIASNTRFIVLQPGKVDPQVLEVLQQALLDDSSVIARYKKRSASEPQTMHLKPLGLSYQDSNIYVSAIFKGLPQGRIAALPLHRFHSAKETLDNLPSPPDFDIRSPAAQRSLIALETLTPIPVKLRINQRLYERLEENALAEDQHMEDLKDGRWIWTGSLHLSQGLDLWLLGQGSDLEVLEPTELRHKISGIARDMAALYTCEEPE